MHREGSSWRAIVRASSLLPEGRSDQKLVLYFRPLVVGGSAGSECVTWACQRDQKGRAEENGLAPYSELGARQIGVLRAEHCHCLLCGHLESLRRRLERFASLSLEMANLFRHS